MYMISEALKTNDNITLGRVVGILPAERGNKEHARNE